MESWEEFAKRQLEKMKSLFQGEPLARPEVNGTSSNTIIARSRVEVSVRSSRSKRIINRTNKQPPQVSSITQPAKRRRSQPLQVRNESLEPQPSTSYSQLTSKFKSSKKTPMELPSVEDKEKEEDEDKEEDENVMVAPTKWTFPMKPVLKYLREPPRPNRYGQRQPNFSYIDEDWEEINKGIAAENEAQAARRRFDNVPVAPIEVYCNCERDHFEDFTPVDKYQKKNSLKKDCNYLLCRQRC